jgi:hypothetical protein
MMKLDRRPQRAARSDFGAQSAHPPDVLHYREIERTAGIFAPRSTGLKISWFENVRSAAPVLRRLSQAFLNVESKDEFRSWNILCVETETHSRRGCGTVFAQALDARWHAADGFKR